MIGKIGKLIGGVLVALGLSLTAKAELTVGDAAPDFRLQDQNGEWHELADYRGRWVVLYFYPKDDTPAAPRRPAPFVTTSSPMKNSAPRFLASASTTSPRTKHSPRNTACRFRCSLMPMPQRRPTMTY
jgi:peroxiredoxin